MAKVFRALALLLAVLLPVSAAAEEGVTEIREYRVLRDGDEIGSHTFSISRDQDMTVVRVKTDLAVKIAFITAFRFEHERTEVWQNDRLLSVVSRTNDDGDEYLISARASDDGFLRKVNGRTELFGGGVRLASFWDRDVVLSSNSFFSAVVDETYDVSISAPKVEELWISDQNYDAEYYRMSGDLEYDMWYDVDGSPLKIAFEKRGSQIEWVLK